MTAAQIGRKAPGMNRIQPIFLTIVIAMWLPCALVMGSIFGCAPGTTGLIRPMSDGAYSTTTNVVAIAAQSGSAVLPVPFSTALEAAAAAVLALLAAWQGFTHKKLREIAARQPTIEYKDPL